MTHSTDRIPASLPNDADRALASRICRTLDADVDAYDAVTLSRLNRARQRALAAALPRSRRWFGASLALASAASVAFAMLLWPGPPAQRDAADVPIADAARIDDLELIAAPDDLALYQQDLAFLAWLDSELDG